MSDPPPAPIRNRDEVPYEVERWTTPKGRYAAQIHHGWTATEVRTFRSHAARERSLRRILRKLEAEQAEARAHRLGSYRLPGAQP